MKKRMYYLFLLLWIAGGISLVSCSDDNDIEENGSEIQDPLVDDVEVKVLKDKSYTVEEMADMLFGADGANNDESFADLRQQFLAHNDEMAKEIEDKVGSNGVAMSYRSIEYLYTSVDQHGEPVELSSMVWWGQYWLPFFGWNDLDPNNIYLVEHFTITSNDECPTSSKAKEQVSLGDNLVIMPDYIGYGYTRNRLHPYLNHEVCAQNSIDALYAGYKIFLENSDAKLEDDWGLYVLGASQGGGNALAVHKYLDTHPWMAESWRFQYSYCCAGPYSPELTMRKYLEWGKMSYPCVIPLVVKSMLDSYPNILGKWKEEDFYSSKYCDIKQEVDRMLAEKELDADAINKKMKELIGTKEILIKDLVSEDMMNDNSEMAKAFFECLKKQDLTTGWTPKHLIKLYHGKSDDVVPYENATLLVDNFGKGKVDLFNSSVGGGHIFTCVKWYGTLMVNNW